MMLNFDSQKSFARARNIACSVELKDSDSREAVPLNVSKNILSLKLIFFNNIFRFMETVCVIII